MAKHPFNLVVGSTLQLQPEGMESEEQSQPVTLIGYLDGESILVSQPATQDYPVGASLVVRFESGDNLYAFESEVIQACDTPFPYLHLRYPAGVQGVMTRRSVRFPVNDMAMMLVMEEDGRKMSVALADISLAGARLVAGVRLGEVGDRFSIEIPHTHHGGAERVVLPCEIRYVREESSQTSGKRVFHHGVEFTGLSKKALVFIEHYIGDRVVERRGA